MPCFPPVRICTGCFLRQAFNVGSCTSHSKPRPSRKLAKLRRSVSFNGHLACRYTWQGTIEPLGHIVPGLRIIFLAGNSASPRIVLPRGADMRSHHTHLGTTAGNRSEHVRLVGIGVASGPYAHVSRGGNLHARPGSMAWNTICGQSTSASAIVHKHTFCCLRNRARSANRQSVSARPANGQYMLFDLS